MKKNRRKHFLKATALSMALVMLMTMSPVSAVPKSTEGSELLDRISEQNREAFELFQETGDISVLSGYDAYNGIDTQVPKLYSSQETTTMPETFDLRDVNGDGDETTNDNYVTPVKDQSPWGTCWGFSAIAMSESSVLSEADKLGLYDTYKDIDLSELHLAWFARTPIPEDFPVQAGEGTAMFDGKETQRLNTGGYPYSATSIFSSGIGPVLESDAPYMNGSGKMNEITSGNEIIAANYAPDDTWFVPESLRFKQYLEMEETKVLPCPNGKDEDGNYSYNAAATAAIKKELMAGRAVSICFMADASSPDDKYSTPIYINFNTDGTWAHYTYDEGTGGNHAVTIVGWDDNYKIENFGITTTSGDETVLVHGSESRPPENGAWIVKNSWGSDDVEIPNKWSWGTDEDRDGKGEGYFYLSYYDKSLELPETVDFDLEAQHGDSYIIDQHDLMPSNAVSTGAIDGEVSMANVFTAEERQNIYSISTETATPGTKVAYEIYKLNESFDKTQDPRDGKLLEKGEAGPYEYGGYHKIPLKDRYRIPAGQKYSVVVTLENPAGYDEMFVDKALNKAGTESINAVRESLGMSEEYMSTSYTKGVVNAGESYLCADGEWIDWADMVEELKEEDIESWNDGEDEEFWLEEGPYDYDNFSIKAYADPDSSSVLSAGVKAADGQKEYHPGETVKYTVTVKNDSAYDAAGITVTDSIVDLGSKGKIAFLAAGKSDTIEYDYTVTEEDAKKGKIVNTVKVTNKEGDSWEASCTVKAAPKPVIEPEYKATTVVAGAVKVKTDKKGNAKTISVPKKYRNKKSITVKATVKVDGKTYDITTIGANTFKNCKKVTKIVLPASITKIEKKAFTGAKKLKTIKFKGKKAPVVKKGAFKSLKTKKMTVQVNKKMKNKEFKKFKKALKKAGFKGKVVKK